MDDDDSVPLTREEFDLLFETLDRTVNNTGYEDTVKEIHALQDRAYNVLKEIKAQYE